MLKKLRLCLAFSQAVDKRVEIGLHPCWDLHHAYPGAVVLPGLTDDLAKGRDLAIGFGSIVSRYLDCHFHLFEPYRYQRPDGFHGYVYQLVRGFGRVYVDFSLPHCLLDPAWRVGSLGLGVDGVPGDYLNYLTALVLYDLLSLLCGQANFAFLDYLLGDGDNISRLEGFYQILFRAAISTARIFEDVFYCQDSPGRAG